MRWRHLPRIVFVLGKGGSGRSSVAAALGTCCAARGEKTLIVQWSLSDPISPWFGLPPAGHEAQPLAERLWTMNFSLDETLREYFVGHLRLNVLHDAVIANRHVQRLIHAAPGLTELLFCGRLFWLTRLAREETGADFARIVVDAPASGHGRTLFSLPTTLDALDPAGLLALESGRLTSMLRDPSWTGALVVTLAEELGIEEALEQIPRLRRDLDRGPLAFAVNRSSSRFAGDGEPDWLAPLGASFPAAAGCLRALHRELRSRKDRELALRNAVEGATPLGLVAFDDVLLLDEAATPRAVVDHMAGVLDRWLDAPP